MSESIQTPADRVPKPAARPTQAALHTSKCKPFNWLWWVIVVVPSTCAMVYYGLTAADQYQSESSFVVRSSKNQSSGDGLGILFQNMGIARAQDDTYTVQEYMRSRSALNELKQSLPVRSFYENKGDTLSRFNGFGLDFLDSEEAFYQYYSQKVTIHFDSISGISTLQVQSFDPAESQEINQALLTQGEKLINKINNRARKDTVRFAEQTVITAQENVRKTADELMQYRTENGVLDLKEQSVMQLALISKLQDELITIQTQLDQVRAVTPDNPQISGLKTRERSLLAEIGRQTQQMTGATGHSIANKAAQYQKLTLENNLAEQQLTSALAALENAKREAERQQLYLEVISQPNQPDMPQAPSRIYSIIASFVISLTIYGILHLILSSIREHKN